MQKKLAIISLQMLEEKQHVPFDPNTKLQLDFDQYTIAQNLKATLREKIHKPTLQQYYEKCMEWYPGTFGIIDWDIFRLVYRKQAKKKKIYNGSTNNAGRLKTKKSSVCPFSVHFEIFTFFCKSRVFLDASGEFLYIFFFDFFKFPRKK